MSRRAHAGRTEPPAPRPAAALAAAGIRPAKARGQNFLVQPRIADRIVAAAEPAPSDEIVEVGPGLGILSDRIARSAIRRFTMVELDRNLAAALAERFASDPHVHVVCADFLALNIQAIVERSPIKIIGNLPYNAATAILRRLCDFRPLIARMVLMFQREVGERIRARCGTSERSALSAFTALYWKIEDHFRVLAGSFHPRPKVDSEVIIFQPRVAMPFEPFEEHAVLETVRAAFSAPRQSVRNPLARGLALPTTSVAAALESIGIDPLARAAAIETDDFVRIARTLVLRDSKP